MVPIEGQENIRSEESLGKKAKKGSTYLLLLHVLGRGVTQREVHPNIPAMQEWTVCEK